MSSYALSLVIPCYNEAEGMAALHDRLAEVMPELRRQGSVELILVDDGSSDATYELMEKAFANWPDVTIARHERNRGLGAALRTGFAHAQGAVIIVTDSDGTYPYSDIPLILKRLQPGVDIVTASPYHPEGGIENVPGYRVLLSKGASLIYRVLIDHRIYCYTSMFRAYRREVIEQITTNSDGFLMGTELLVEAMLAGFRVVEHPAILRVRRYGQSKARLVRITRSHLAFQAGLIGRKLRRQQPASLQRRAG